MDQDKFAYRVSHDLKAPFNGISTLAEFLEEDYGDRLDDAGREQLRLIRSLASRGISIIEALGLYARVSKAPVNGRALDLAALFKRLAATAVVRTPAAVAVHVDEGLPDVLADPTLVPVMLNCLLANAVLYHEGPARRIWFERAPHPAGAIPADHVALRVRDDGIGVPEQHRDEVFELFRRLHAKDKFGAGAGAGLTIARRIVERHGGKMWIEASHGTGTSVVFSLPANPGSVAVNGAR